MAEITLKRERPTLTVNIGDEQYKVPLTFTRSEMESLGKDNEHGEAVFAFFEKYLGEVYNQLGDDDLSVLFQAWSDARKKVGAPSMGELKASPR